MTALLPKLAMLLADEYELHNGVQDGVRYLQEELTTMHAVLEAVSQGPAAGHHPDEAQLRPWKRKVRELAYDAEDTVDSYLVRVSAWPPGGRLSCSRPWGAVLHAARRFKARRRIAVEIERIKGEVREASERRRRFWVPEAAPRPPSPLAAAQVDPRLHLRYENAAGLVGVGRSMEELMRKLSLDGDDGEDARGQRLKVVAVVGAGGIGKTTLAREVYGKVREKFDCGAFVPVPHGADVRFVLGRILQQVSQASGENHESWGVEEIIERIRDVLQDKR